MTKIVVCYDIYGGFECGSYPQVLCFEYESSEAWLLDFETALKSCKDTEWKSTFHEFDFCFYKFRVGDFETRDAVGKKTGQLFLPDVYELNEWFAQRVGHND